MAIWPLGFVHPYQEFNCTCDEITFLQNLILETGISHIRNKKPLALVSSLTPTDVLDGASKSRSEANFSHITNS